MFWLPTGVNTNLVVRFKRGEIYTSTGTILVAVNPYEYYNLYEEKMMRSYTGKKMGDMPPHVFATAEAAYQRVQYVNPPSSPPRQSRMRLGYIFGEGATWHDR